jgi:hypothetical protein
MLAMEESGAATDMMESSRWAVLAVIFRRCVMICQKQKTDVREAKGKKVVMACLGVIFVLMIAVARSRRHLTQSPKSRAHD